MLRSEHPTASQSDPPTAAQSRMPQSVERLKELLFDREAQAMRDLAQRIERVSEADVTGRQELKDRIEEIFNRAGTDERLAKSVSAVLAPALRQAEVFDHRNLADSIAPLVVSTIKTELRNSQDEMVEALYPITGRLVKSYVASAIRDLSTQMNRRLEQNPVMLRLQSLTTGRSVAELALAGGPPFELKELYLIRRGTGELIARWPNVDVSTRDQALSGVFTAINEFANDAWSADQGALRQVDLGSEIAYLRASPIYLMAARGSNTAGPAIEQVIDDIFLETIEQQQKIEARPDAEQATARMAAIKSAGETLTKRVNSIDSATPSPSRSFAPLKAAAVLVLLPLLSWYGYNAYDTFMNERVKAKAMAIIAATPNMGGYPTTVHAESRGRIVEVKGLTPTEPTHRDIIANITRALPGTNVIDGLAALPAGAEPSPDLTPDIAALKTDLEVTAENLRREAAAATLDHAIDKIRSAGGELRFAAQTAPDDALRADLEATATKTSGTLNTLIDARKDLLATGNNKAASKLKTSFEEHEAELKNLFARITPGTGEAAISQNNSDNPASAAIQSLEARADRVASLASSIALATRLKPAPTPPPPAPIIVREAVEPPALTPRQRLEAVTSAKAVFFANGTDYRDGGNAATTLDAIAAAAKDTNLLLRIVGYTDEAGGTSINNPLALQRAEKIRQELINRGIKDTLIAVVGRNDRIDISAIDGQNSPNRRVEFEIGFDGEAAR